MNLLDRCENCKLKECIACEYTWNDLKETIEHLQKQYDKDTHILQDQLDLANARIIELQKENEELKNMDLTTVYINGVEDEKSKILELIDFGVKATNTNDEYSVGMCNGMLYIKSVILDRDIEYKECPKNSISKDKIRDCLEDIEDYFENVSVPKEDIEFIKEKRKDLLKEE